MSSGQGKIVRKRLSDQVIDRLIAMIASGALQPGDRLPPEPGLMDQFGVGRSSIREAVGALELLGLVSVRPGDGTRLTTAAEAINSRAVGLSLITLGHEAIRDLVEARVDLEQSIARHAALRATDRDMEQMRTQHAKMLRANCSDRTFIAADIAFHSAIAEASHNTVLIRFFSELRQPVRHWMEQKHRFDWGRDQVAEDHEAIMRAIEARNADAAGSAMGRHVERAGNKLVAAMQPPGNTA